MAAYCFSGIQFHAIHNGSRTAEGNEAERNILLLQSVQFRLIQTISCEFEGKNERIETMRRREVTEKHVKKFQTFAL